MGAHPKRRISSKRRGTRRKDHGIAAVQPAQTAAPLHKRGLIEQIKKFLSPNE